MGPGTQGPWNNNYEKMVSWLYNKRVAVLVPYPPPSVDSGGDPVQGLPRLDAWEVTESALEVIPLAC